MTLPELCSWLNRLRAIPPDRVKDAIGRIHALGLSELPRQLRHPQSLDDVVRIVLLAEDIDALMERGVPTNKLVAKLRDVAQFETTSAEIRCCALLARRSDEDVGFELESGKSRGAHPDVRLLLPEGPPHSIIEIKAVGLSNAERTFMRRMSASLGLMTPRVGLANLHAGIDDAPPRFTTAQLRAIRDEAARWASSIPGFPQGLAASTIVLRESETHYIRRVAHGVEKAVRQMPFQDECWIAIYGTNGAPVDDVLAALDWDTVPERVLGLVFVGCFFAFPHRNLDCYVIAAPRGSVGTERW